MGAPRRLSCADIAAGARQVLNIELLAKTLGEFLGDRARKSIGWTGHSKGNDQDGGG